MRHFNRHSVSETRGLIQDLITEVRDANENARSIENMLYGLFDGFDYSDKIKNHEEFQTLPTVIQLKLVALCETISNYPTSHTS